MLILRATLVGARNHIPAGMSHALPMLFSRKKQSNFFNTFTHQLLAIYHLRSIVFFKNLTSQLLKL
jgi:hypothetical protein